MHREIVLGQDTRYFRKPIGMNVLLFEERYRRAGDTLTIGSEEDVIYDHTRQPAAPFRQGGETYYLLASELKASEN